MINFFLNAAYIYIVFCQPNRFIYGNISTLICFFVVVVYDATLMNE